MQEPLPAYVGIDTALRHTGVVVLRGPNTVLCSTVSPKSRGPQRLMAIYDEIEELLRSAGVLDPGVRAFAATEGYAYDAPQGAAGLGEASGTVRLLLGRLRIPERSVAPVQLKKYVTGRITAKKRQMIEESQRASSLPIGDDHQADAHGLARIARDCALVATGQHIKWNARYEADVVRAVMRDKSPRKAAGLVGKRRAKDGAL